MMIIIKEAYLRDILVLRFPPSSRLLCHPTPSAGEFVCASPLGGSRQGEEATEVLTE